MHWFVSRHPGALLWAKSQSLIIDRAISHLDISQVQPGDTVTGTLPVHLAEQVCRRGARYRHLTLTLPETLRGQELSANQMDHLQAKITEYTICKTE